MALKILDTPLRPEEPREPTWWFHVRWSMDVEARSPEEAAFLAARSLHDPMRLSHAFEVTGIVEVPVREPHTYHAEREPEEVTIIENVPEGEEPWFP